MTAWTRSSTSWAPGSPARRNSLRRAFLPLLRLALPCIPSSPYRSGLASPPPRPAWPSCPASTAGLAYAICGRREDFRHQEHVRHAPSRSAFRLSRWSLLSISAKAESDRRLHGTKTCVAWAVPVENPPEPNEYSACLGSGTYEREAVTLGIRACAAWPALCLSRRVFGTCRNVLN
jgi:hypothetical protein